MRGGYGSPTLVPSLLSPYASHFHKGGAHDSVIICCLGSAASM